MILSNVEIRQALDAKRLVIDPEPLPRTVGPGQYCPYATHSVDLRLGAHLRVLQEGPYNFDLTLPNFSEFLERNSDQLIIESGRPFILEPNRFILGIMLERVSLPTDVPVNQQTNSCLAARIEGKSSRARCGLLVHFTAPTVHPGWDGPLALEMINQSISKAEHPQRHCMTANVVPHSDCQKRLIWFSKSATDKPKKNAATEREKHEPASLGICLALWLALAMPTSP